MSNVFFTNRAAIPAMHSASGLFTTVIRYIMICLKYQANSSTVAKVSKISTAVTVTACSPRPPTATEPVAITYSVMDYVEAFAPIYCPIVVAVISIMVVFALLYVLYHSVLALVDGVTQASRWFANTRFYAWIVRIAQWVSRTRFYACIRYIVLWIANSYPVVAIGVVTFKGYRYIQSTYFPSAQENTELFVEVSSKQNLPELTVKFPLLEEVMDEAHIMEPIHAIAINEESTKLQKEQFQEEQLLIEYPLWTAVEEDYTATVSLEAAAEVPKLVISSLEFENNSTHCNPFRMPLGHLFGAPYRLRSHRAKRVEKPKVAIKKETTNTSKVSAQVVNALRKDSFHVSKESFEKQRWISNTNNNELLFLFLKYKQDPEKYGNELVELLDSSYNHMAKVVSFFDLHMNTKWRPSSDTDQDQMELCIDFFILFDYCETVQLTCKHLHKKASGKVRDIIYVSEIIDYLLLSSEHMDRKIDGLRREVETGQYSYNLVKALSHFADMALYCERLLRKLSEFEHYNFAEVMHRLDLEHLQNEYYNTLCESRNADSSNVDVERCLRDLSYKFDVSERIEA